jgi:EmrB/QacA subfamily drug resistance transporter
VNDGYLGYRVLWALVPAMAMVMIDFTIVSISATTIQGDLHLSDTGIQWLVTGYTLSIAAFVALGGRLGDVLGHRTIVIAGVVLFAASSAICGLVPDGSSISEEWLIVFRILQGVGGGLLVPSATVLVLNSFAPADRGKGLSVFFIVAGLFTAVGPIAGSYITEYWTWRGIFWINVPVALLALIEMSRIKLDNTKNPARIDWRGAFLIVAGMGLSVLGIQQSTVWGWGDPRTIGSIVLGVLLLVAFVFAERSARDPLIDVRAMAANRPFAVDNILTFFAFGPWLGVFFFGSMYFQVAVHQPPTQAGFSILTMFYTFFVGSRIGGGWMDEYGAKRPVVLGFLLAAAGMVLWGTELDNLGHLETSAGMLVTGAGFGLIFSSLNADALNRVPEEIRGQASGITQTFRNFGSAIGMAVMGTIVAGATNLNGASGAQDFADAMSTAYYVGAGMLAVGLVIALRFMADKQVDIQ